MTKGIGFKDHSVYTTRTTPREAGLCLRYQVTRYALLPTVATHGDAVQVTAPPVPASDDRTDYVSVRDSQEQGLGVSCKQCLDSRAVFLAVRVFGMRPPEGEHGIHVLVRSRPQLVVSHHTADYGWFSKGVDGAAPENVSGNATRTHFA